jgi:hypothetical protein
MGGLVKKPGGGCVVKTKERLILVSHKQGITKATLERMLEILDHPPGSLNNKASLIENVRESGESIHVFAAES